MERSRRQGARRAGSARRRPRPCQPSRPRRVDSTSSVAAGARLASELPGAGYAQANVARPNGARNLVAAAAAIDEKVAAMRPVSGIGHARHDTPSAAASKHTITAGCPVLSNIPWPVAADEARDLGGSGGPGRAP